jgi:hypothetical protein
MKKDAGRSVMLDSSLDHSPGMHRGSINGASEQRLRHNEPMAVVQE